MKITKNWVVTFTTLAVLACGEETSKVQYAEFYTSDSLVVMKQASSRKPVSDDLFSLWLLTAPDQERPFYHIEILIKNYQGPKIYDQQDVTFHFTQYDSDRSFLGKSGAVEIMRHDDEIVEGRFDFDVTEVKDSSQATVTIQLDSGYFKVSSY